jgi:hypothetical protein
MSKDQEIPLPVPHFQTTPRRSRAATVAVLAAATVALGACGSSSGSSPSASSSAQQPQQGQRQGGPFASLSASARACVEKQGVTLPAGGRPGNGQPPNGQPGNGQPPAGAGQRPANSDRFAKMRAALKKCGVNLPNRPPGGGPPQGAPAGTGTSQQ